MKISVGIIGVTGYAGQELLKILSRHPGVSVEYLASRQIDSAKQIGNLIPALRGIVPNPIEPFKLSKAISSCDLLFLALPHGISMTFVPKILADGKHQVIDLSADFRLKKSALFHQAYGLRHSSPSFLSEAAYGLTEWNRKEIRESRLVANPGCYPTATLLGLLPLAQAKLLEPEGSIVDAKSGVTGAGRSLKEELLFSEVNEDLRAYRVDAHPHLPEMEQVLKSTAGKATHLLFVPHLVPINRGLYASIYAPLKRPLSQAALRSIFLDCYADEPFIRILPAGKWPQVKAVSGTHFCEIGLQIDRTKKRAIIFSAIDNLGKGAASQAVQNMNLMNGLPETEGLLT